MTPTLGFRILGGCAGDRRLVIWQAAFAGYAACEPNAKVDSEGYLSAFLFGDDFGSRANRERVDVKGFRGDCGSNWLWIDIDSRDLIIAHDHAKRLAAGLCVRYSLDGDELLIFFSGAKGFHVGLPLSLADSPDAHIDFNQVCRALVEVLADELAVTVDTGIYDKARAFRAPNSRHPKSGKHKRRIEFDEVLYLSTEANLRLARDPNPFDIPEPPPANAKAIADWQAACSLVAAKQQAVAERRDLGDATLNRLTLQFIRQGATAGERQTRLFSAAANLAEFDCPPLLAHALLSEVALDSGFARQTTVASQRYSGRSNTSSRIRRGTCGSARTRTGDHRSHCRPTLLFETAVRFSKFGSDDGCV